jgi:hypothetical protein
MTTRKYAPRLLGAAFLIVALTSVGSGLLLMSAVGSGSISDILVDISNRLTLMRLFILGDLVTSLGIIVLAVLLYVVLNKQKKIVAIVALGFWLTEAMALAISKFGASALIPLSQEFVQAGAPDHSYYQTLGEVLYSGVVVQLGQTTELLFYCFGGMLWYYLFYKSRYVPRVISLFGLTAVSVALVGLAFQFLGHDVSIFVFLPILPFELTIGAWLMLRGIKDEVPIGVAHGVLAMTTPEDTSMATLDEVERFVRHAMPRVAR